VNNLRKIWVLGIFIQGNIMELIELSSALCSSALKDLEEILFTNI
jgi:hypothetical protein